jgi:hypothetical protein
MCVPAAAAAPFVQVNKHDSGNFFFSVWGKELLR